MHHRTLNSSRRPVALRDLMAAGSEVRGVLTPHPCKGDACVASPRTLEIPLAKALAVSYLHRQGLSLTELVVVLAIIGILSAIAVPRYAASLVNYRLDAAARRIAADLEIARSQALTTSQSQAVVFNVAAGTYQMTGVLALDRRSTNYSVALGSDPYFVKLLSANFGGNSTVTFDAYGGADASGTVVLEAGGIQKTVALDRYTGKATVP
jgi:type IV fimbrial biogenesis protein FimT